MMAQGLDTHFDAKLGRELVRAKLRNAALEADLYPVGSPRDHPPGADSEPRNARGDRASDHASPGASETSSAITAGNSEARSEDLLTMRRSLGMPDCSECNLGSNSWAVAGRYTESGKPLLSNDMHLTLLVPDIWYMVDLKAPGYHVAGITMAGIPGIVAGHNEHVAWGITSLYADVQDLYIETLDGKGNFQAADGSWKALSVDREIISVRGGASEEIEVQSTAHGPLLNPILKNEKRAIALKWTLFDQTLNVMPTYELGKASNWTEFSKALGKWCWPTENVAYADDHGVIAYHAAGKIPQRPSGLVGVPIQDAAHEWNGYIPFEALPSAINPPSGILATANSRVTRDGTAYPLSLNWGDPYRTERIYRSLQGRGHLTRGDMLAVQTDVYSEVNQKLGRRFAEAIDHTAGVNDRLHTAAELMRAWDGRMSIDSAAASLVAKTRVALWKMILDPKLGDEAKDYIWSEKGVAQEQIVMRESRDWLPPGYQSWDALLADAVRSVIADENGPADLTKWSYGSWHVVDLKHPLAMLLSFAGQVAGSGSHPLGGDGTTVNQETGTIGPSQRFTMDWGDPDGSTENLVMGESGNPQSPYFHDQWQYWYEGTTFSVPFTGKAIAEQTRHSLHLLP
jgi:penicillin amidase